MSPVPEFFVGDTLFMFVQPLWLLLHVLISHFFFCLFQTNQRPVTSKRQHASYRQKIISSRLFPHVSLINAPYMTDNHLRASTIGELCVSFTCKVYRLLEFVVQYCFYSFTIASSKDLKGQVLWQSASIYIKIHQN